MSSNQESLKVSRRNFLRTGAAGCASLLAANTTIYAVGSAMKELDGSLVAGAKTWVGFNYTYLYPTGNFFCDGDDYWDYCAPANPTCTTPGATYTNSNCGCVGYELYSMSYRCQ